MATLRSVEISKSQYLDRSSPLFTVLSFDAAHLARPLLNIAANTRHHSIKPRAKRIPRSVLPLKREERPPPRRDKNCIGLLYPCYTPEVSPTNGETGLRRKGLLFAIFFLPPSSYAAPTSAIRTRFYSSAPHFSSFPLQKSQIRQIPAPKLVYIKNILYLCTRISIH